MIVAPRRKSRWRPITGATNQAAHECFSDWTRIQEVGLELQEVDLLLQIFYVLRFNALQVSSVPTRLVSADQQIRFFAKLDVCQDHAGCLLTRLSPPPPRKLETKSGSNYASSTVSGSQRLCQKISRTESFGLRPVTPRHRVAKSCGEGFQKLHGAKNLRSCVAESRAQAGG